MFKYILFIILLLITVCCKLNVAFYQGGHNNNNKVIKKSVKSVAHGAYHQTNQEHQWPPFIPVSNSRPIIGILTQEISPTLQNCIPHPAAQYKSYISASYVKYIESAGARVVPICIGQPTRYYKIMATSLNGVLLPGGGAMFTANDGYADAAKIFYSYGINENLPIWGICLGFELIVVLSAGADIRTRCNVNNVAKPLKFRKDFKESKLFRYTPLDVLNVLQTQSVMANIHSYCVTMKNLTNNNMSKDWNVLTLTTENNFTFVSTIESREHPIWGVQYHPEKNIFEWGKQFLVHSQNAIKVSQYLVNFFVNEARKNRNRFSSIKKEHDALIYNHKPIFTAKYGCTTEQCYFFK